MAGWPSLRFICVNKEKEKNELHDQVFAGLLRRCEASVPHPDGADVFEELSHLLQIDLFSQPCDVDCAVLRVVLLFWTSYKHRTHTHKKKST